ncbi:MAG: DUF6802 family protein [Candidatus Omnitrophota bacterium]|jgi:hypothetical protein
MNRIIIGVFICVASFFHLGVALALQSKTVDINKDGKPDVTYQQAEEFATKVEADTNYDGKPDVVVYVENGKFDSAEVDTDYDGKVDKQFNDSAQFKKWVNENRPDFNDSLGWDDWSRTKSKVFWQPGGDNQGE